MGAVRSIGAPRRLDLTREKDLTDQVVELVNRAGGKVWRSNAGVIRVSRRAVCVGPKGCPDVIGAWRGRFLGIETKGPRTYKRTHEADQERFREELRRQGGLAFVARSIDDVLRELGLAEEPAM